ncbi:NAD(P)-binding protein [Streptomyces sp. NPDC001758]
MPAAARTTAHHLTGTVATDVLVVGAGLAGLHVATLLARQGHDVLLDDRRTTLTAAIHTTGIFVRKTLDDFPLPVEHLGPPIRRVLLYPPGTRRPVGLVSDRDEYRVGGHAGALQRRRSARRVPRAALTAQRAVPGTDAGRGAGRVHPAAHTAGPGRGRPGPLRRPVLPRPARRSPPPRRTPVTAGHGPVPGRRDAPECARMPPRARWTHGERPAHRDLPAR